MKYFSFARLLLTVVGAFLLFCFVTSGEAQGRWKVSHGLQGYVPSIATRLAPVGRLAATNRLQMAVGLPLRNQSVLDATLQALNDPSSPQYHHWLTPEQFAEAFGPTESQYQSVVNYLETHGLKVDAKYSNRALLSVSGMVTNVEKAFGVTMRVYRHPKENRTFYTADKVPSLDADVPVLGISGLDNYEPPHPRNLIPGGQSITNYTATGSGPGGVFIGKDFRAAYAPGVSLDGTGQFVAVIGGQYFSNDPVIYASDAGLPPPTITNIYVGGAPHGDPAPGSDAGEQSLDISMIISMAPRATVMFYEGNIDACFVQMAIDNKAKQISCSLGWGPASPMLAQEFEQFDAQGQAFFAASGDAGSGGNDSDSSGGGPGAANQYITLVGGTSLTTSGAGGPWTSETAWGGSGGAVCVNLAIPSYQQGISMANNQGSTVYRNFPDVAMQADTDIFIVSGGSSGSVGGTSAAAPLWAGFMALVNQQANLHGNPPVGFLNPAIYPVGKSPGYASAMHDITTGNNHNSTYPTMFSAVSGYDLCTGWGSPRGQATIDALAGTNASPNFSLTVPSVIGNTVNDLTVRQGSNVTTTVTIISGNGFNGSVNLSALDLPGGVTAAFSPATATSTSALTFTASSAAPISASPVTVTIVGTGGNLIRTVTLNLRVVAGTSATPNFSLSISPGTLAVTPGGSSTSQIAVNTLGGFTASVSLSASGLPSGVTAVFNPLNSTAGSAVTFIAAAGAVIGTNTVTITGISGSLTRTFPVTLMVINPNQIVTPTIANFGFETPSLGAGNSVYNPASAGWTFGGSSPDGSGIVATGSSFSNPAAPEGVQAAFLQEYSTISQAISGFIPGINYTITFAAAERSTVNTAGETWNVMIDNAVVGSYHPGTGATAYVDYAANFTASAGVHTLSFVGTDLANGNNTIFLDNIRITVATNQLAAPAISLTSPANPANFTAPATINLTASVATNGNVINSVQFYANTAVIGQVATPPYTYAWASVSNGNYNVFAQVTYNNGSVVDSVPANIAVTNTSLNLGFETPGLGAGNYQNNPSGASWVFSASTTLVNSSGIAANGSALGNPPAPEGVQAAFVREQGTVSQTLGGLTPGVNYTVTYSAAQRVGSAQTWNVLLDNTAIQINNLAGSTNYTTYAANFTASATVHTLSFVGTDLAGGDNTVFLDNVSLSANENLGFEIPAIGNGNYQYGPVGGSWVFSGSSPLGSGIVANGSGFSNPKAPQGTQAGFVQQLGTLSQSISGLIPGTNYVISFQAAQRPGNAQSWRVTMNGITIGNYNPGGGATAYTNYTASFTATASTETLAFVGTDLGGGDNTIFIDAVQITAVAPGAPAASPVLTAVAGNTQVGLNWTTVSGATSYNVASSLLDGGPYTMVATVTGANYLSTGLVNGTPYYYVVSAVNANGAGASSSQASATPQVPPPATVTAVAGNSQVTLKWTAVAGAVSYQPAISTVDGGPYTTLGNVAGTSFFSTGLSNGTTYYFIVVAMTSSGPTANSVQVSALPPGPALTTVTNFGFETPVVTAGSFQYGPVGSGWTFSGNSPQGSGIIANGSGFGSPNAPQGIQAAFVQNHGTITQTLTGFIPGTNYTVSFLAAERPNYAAQSWNVTINGATVGSYNPGASATAYVNYTASFTATATSQVLGFVGTDLSGSDSTIFIDDVQIAITGLTSSPNPLLVTNTLPVTAADVVGSQVTFTAGFMAGSPLAYQWQKITGGVTNTIPGATSPILTLVNLQLADTASYQLRASNSFGVAFSSPSSLTVSSVPAAVNNVIVAYAAQTGFSTGAALTPTWTLAANSVIAGQLPNSTSGNFNLEPYWQTRSVSSLTAGGSLTIGSGGNPATATPSYVTCGNGAGAGSLIVYNLTNTSAAGYNLTNLTVYGGWRDSGRDQQGYTVYYSTVAAPTTFIFLGNVSYTPANAAGAACATRTTFTPATGVLATNVAAVKFDFTTPTTPNGWCGYAQIQLFGTPLTVPPATNSTNILFQVTGNNLTLNWPADHIGWRLQVQTNNLNAGLGTNWWDVAGSTTTNQVTLPIDSTDGSIFYRLIYLPAQ